MLNKTRIADVGAAYDTLDTMSIGGVLGVGGGKKSRKAGEAVIDAGPKRSKTSSATEAAAAHAAPTSAVSAEGAIQPSLRQGKSLRGV
jgi:hypothetical protein